jgi:hypothetical protein
MAQLYRLGAGYAMRSLGDRRGGGVLWFTRRGNHSLFDVLKCLRSAKMPHHLHRGGYLDRQSAQWTLWTRHTMDLDSTMPKEALARLP